MKALRIPLRVLLLLFLVVVIAGGFLYWVGTRTGILEQQVNVWLDSFLSAQLPLAVTIEDIGGESWHHLLVTGIRVEEISGDTLVPLLRIDTLEVHYDWRNLISRTWIISHATIAGVRGRLRSDANGNAHLPWQISKSTSSPPLKAPEIELESVTLRRVEIVKTGADTVRLLLGQAQGSLQMLPGRIDQRVSFENLRIEGPRSIQIDSSSAHVLVLDKEWFINDVFVLTAASRLSGFARITRDSTQEVFANVSLSPGRWNDLAMWANVNLPGSGNLDVEARYADGMVSGRGTISGTLFERRLDGLGLSLNYDGERITFDTLFGRALGASLNGSAYLDLSARPLAYGLSATTDGLNLQELLKGEFQSDLSGHLNVIGRGVTSEDLEVRVNTPNARGLLKDFYLDSMQGDLVITTEAIQLEPGFKASYLGINASLAGPLEFAGNMQLEGRVTIPDVRPVLDYLGYPGSGGASEGTFSLTSTSADPTLSFDVLVDSLTYKGAIAPRARIHSRLTHAFTAAKGTVTGRLFKADMWGVATDSAFAAIQVDPEYVHADPMQIYRGADSINSSARLIPASGSLTVGRFNATVLDREFDLAWPAELGLFDDTLWIHNISLRQGEGSTTMNGWLEYDGAMQLQATVSNAIIGPWVSLDSRADEFDGNLFADLQITGRLDAPHTDFNLRLKESTYRLFPLGEFSARGNLTPDALQIDSIALHTGDEEYSGVARIPLHQVESMWKPDHTRTLDARLLLRGTGMRLIRLLLPDVESLSGQVHGTARITGTLDQPTLSGLFEINDGQLKVWQLRDPLTRLDVAVEFHDSVATIQSLMAHVDDGNDEGDITGQGTMTFRDLSTLDYDIALRGAEVPARYEFGDFTGRFDFDMSLTGSERPVVSGNVKVREAYYRDPFEAEDSLSQVVAQVIVDTSAWDINLDVDIPKNAWTKNKDVNAEWSGNLRVLRDRGNWNYLGSLEPLRGSYTFVGRRFRNLRGHIVFDDIHRVDPTLNLEADINLPYYGDPDGSIQATSHREITVRVEGRLSEPRIIPPAWLGEHNLIQALTVGGAQDGNGLDVGESAKLGASGFLASQLELFGVQTLGVETFELRPSEQGSYDLQDARLRIGTYLLPDIYVYGTGGINLTQGTELGFEYRLRNWLTLQGNRDVDNLYQFDLNLKLDMNK